MSLGNAEVITSLNTKPFEDALKKLKATTLADLKEVSKGFDGIVAKGLFDGANTGARAFVGTLKPIRDELKGIVAEAEKLGGAFAKGGSGAPRVKKEIDPLIAAVRSVSNELNNYKVRFEAGEDAQDQFVKSMQGVISNARALRDTVDQSSTQYGRLTNIIGTATRSITTAEGQVSKLGLSQQVAIGTTNRLTDSVKQLGGGVVQLGGALPTLLGVAGLGGLSTVSGDLATKANAVNVSYDILGLTMDRVGASSGAVQASISNTADALGVAEGQVVDYATQLLRIGVAADQIDDVLIAGGSSALAFGKSAAQGIDSVTSSLVTQNSQNLNSIGIAENIGKAMGEAADGAAAYGEAASKQAAAQAGVQIILKATADEVASLDKLTGGLAGAQNEAATSAFELKQRVGEMLVPFETLKNEALAGLLDSFAQMPQTTQASVASIGGVTVAVSALATGASALRLALVPLFAPPAGLIIGGAVAAAALGTALFTLAQNANKSVTPFKTLGENAAVTQGAIGQAGDKETLAGALEALSTQLDGKAKESLITYAGEVRNAKGDVDDLKKSASDLVTQITLDQALAERGEIVAKLKVVPEVEGLDPEGIVADLEARLNRSPEFQGQGIQLKLGIVEEGGQYAIQVLDGISKNATLSAESFALLDNSINETNVRLNTTADAAGDQLRGEIQRLDVFIQSLRDSLAGTAEAAAPVAENVGETGEAADNAAGSVGDLADETERLDPALRAVARAQLEAQDYRLDAYFAEAAASASDFTTALDALNAKALEQTEADQAAIQATKDLVAARFEAANQASPYDASGPTALTEALQAAVTASGYMTDAQRAANLELREGATSAESFSDSLAGLNDEGRIAGQYFSTAAVSASDFTTSLDQLNAEAAETNINLRDSATGAESFSDTLGRLNKLATQVNLGSAVDDGTDAAKDATDAFSDTLNTISDVTDAVLGLADAFGVELPDAITDAAKATEGFVALGSKLASGDILGFIAEGINLIGNALAEERREIDATNAALEKYGEETLRENNLLGWLDRIDEDALAEYEQYLAAIEEHGQAIADKYVTINEQGQITFNEEAFTEAQKGLERLEQTAADLEQEMRDVKDAVDSVNAAELEAKQLTLDAKIEGQDGAYSVNDILAQVDLDIAEAARKRDDAYAEAAELEAAGYKDLADRRRAAADEAYRAEVSTIKEGAEDRADAIGQNSDEFKSTLDADAAASEQYYNEYWNADTNAQLAAERRAREQLRRQEAVMNSQRYQDLLNAGYTEQEAYRLSAEGMGYTIDATTGDLVTAEEQAGQQHSQAITNSSSFVTSALQTAFSGLSAAYAGQGGALSSTISSVYAQLAGATAAGSNAFTSTIQSAANAQLKQVAAAANALGALEAKSGTYIALQKKKAAEAQIRAEVVYGNAVNAGILSVANAKNLQTFRIAESQAQATAAAYNAVIGTIAEGNGNVLAAYQGVYKQVTAKLGKNAFAKLVKASGPVGLKDIQADVVKNIDPRLLDNAQVIDPEKVKEQQASKDKAAADKANAPKGSLNYIDKQISDLEEQYKKETDPKKRAELAKKIKALKAQRDKIDVLAEDGKSGSKSSSGSGSSSSSGKDIGPKGSPSYIQEEIRKLDEQINKSNSESKIRELQKKKEVLEAQLDKLLGRDGPTKPGEPAKGSVDYIQKQLQEAQAAYDSATTDKARAAAAERIKVLKNELEEKQALLKDAAKDAQEAVKGTVISIESPLASLGSLQYLAESVSRSVSALPASISSASTGAAASVTQIPESYTSTVLPSYQAQQDMAVAMGGHVDRFGGHIDRFGAFVTRLERLEGGRAGGSNSSIPVKSKGQGLSDMMLRGI